MRIDFSRLARVALLALPLLLSHPRSAVADIVVTVDAPGIQASTVAGVTTMNFDSVTPGYDTTLSSPIGTYTAPASSLVVLSPNSYGGANQTNYMAVGAVSGQLQPSLALNAPVAYFGFYWSAGDAGNVVKLFDDNTLLGSFNVGSIIPLLQTTGGPLGSGHFGNPNTGADGSEPFAYVNFIATGGEVFNRIEFMNTLTYTGFESDNHSIRSAPLVTPFPGTVVGNISAAAVPEPAPLALLVLGLLPIGLLARKRYEPSP